MIKNIEIDFSNVKDKDDVIRCFEKAFGFPIAKYPGWDGFNDYFRNFRSDSLISKLSPFPEEVHLTLKNLGKVAGASKSTYSTLCEILVEATDMDNRADGVRLTFNVVNEYSKTF